MEPAGIVGLNAAVFRGACVLCMCAHVCFQLSSMCVPVASLVVSSGPGSSVVDAVAAATSPALVWSLAVDSMLRVDQATLAPSASSPSGASSTRLLSLSPSSSDAVRAFVSFYFAVVSPPAINASAVAVTALLSDSAVGAAWNHSLVELMGGVSGDDTLRTLLLDPVALHDTTQHATVLSAIDLSLRPVGVPRLVLVATDGADAMPLWGLLASTPALLHDPTLMFVAAPDAAQAIRMAAANYTNMTEAQAQVRFDPLDGLLSFMPTRGIFQRQTDMLAAWEKFILQPSAPTAVGNATVILLQPMEGDNATRWSAEGWGASGSGSLLSSGLLSLSDVESLVWDAVSVFARATSLLEAAGSAVTAAAVSHLVTSPSFGFIGVTGAIRFDATTGGPAEPRFAFMQMDAAELARGPSSLIPPPSLGFSVPTVAFSVVGHWQPLIGVDFAASLPSSFRANSSMGSSLAPLFASVTVRPPDRVIGAAALAPLGQLRACPNFAVPPPAMYGMCTAMDDSTDTLLVWGGTLSAAAAPYAQFWRFSLVTLQWQRQAVLGNAPVGRFYGGCAVRDGDLFVFGGVSGRGVMGDLWRLRVSSNVWTSIQLSGDVSDVSARSQFGFSSNGTIFGWMGGRHAPAAATAPVRFDVWLLDMQLRGVSVQWPVFSASSWLQPDLPALDADAGSVFLFLSNLIYPCVCAARFQGRSLLWIFSGYLSDPHVNWIYDIDANLLAPFFSRNLDMMTADGGQISLRERSLVNALFDASRSRIYISHGWSETNQTNWPDAVSVDVTCPGVQCGMWRDEGAWGDPRDSFQTSLLGTQLVSFAGWGSILVHNDLWIKDTLVPHSSGILLAGDYIAPTPRKLHSLTRVATFMLLFGGQGMVAEGAPNQPLNDLWSFDISTREWAAVNELASPPPPPRYAHVAVSALFQLYVHGGTPDGSTFLGDLWSFSVFARTWTELTPAATATAASVSALWPTPRAYHVAKAAHDDEHVILYGGVDSAIVNSPPSEQLWIFSLSTLTWTMLRDDARSADRSGLPTPVTRTCSVWLDGFLLQLPANASRLIRMGGVDSGFNPTNEVWSIEPLASTPVWRALSPMPEPRSSALASLVGSAVYVYSGLYYDVLRPQLWMYDVIADSWQSVPSSDSSGGSSALQLSPRMLANGAAATSGNDILFFGGSSAQFGDVHTAQFVVNDQWVMHAAHACSSQQQPWVRVPSDCQPCGRGTVSQATVCLPCPAGTYEQQGLCMPCDAGFAGAYAGASTQAVCLPCGDGSYADVPGLSACKPCALNETCPAGSVLPLSGSFASNSQLAQYSFAQSQPAPLLGRSADVSRYSSVLLWLLVAFVSALCAYYLYLRSYSNADPLSRWDLLFPLAHMQMLNAPMWKRQTPMGGLFTLLSVFVLSYIISTLALPYALDNYIERRSLIPNANMFQAQFTAAEIAASVQLGEFKAQCVEGHTLPNSQTNTPSGPLFTGACTPLISVVLSSGAHVGAVSQSCTAGFEAAPSGGLPLPFCRVDWHCAGCSQFPSLSSLRFSFLSSGAYATQIDWTLSSSTGIPSGASRLWGSVVSASDRFLRGNHGATTIAVDVTQTAYAQPAASFSDTGYHLDYASTTIGPTTLPQSFYAQGGIIVHFDVTRALDTLVISKEEKLTPALFLSSLLGGVSGALAALAALLLLVETAEDVTLDAMGRKARSSWGRMLRAMAIFKLTIVRQAIMAQEARETTAEIALTAAMAQERKQVAADAAAGRLPAACTGALDLESPTYLANEGVSQVTLPSRLSLLGRRAWHIFSILSLRPIGNSILAQVPMLTESNRRLCGRNTKLPRRQWIILPYAASKAAARMLAFVRIVVLLVLAVVLLDLSGAVPVNVGKAWLVGCACTLFVLWCLTSFKRTALGTIGFCRSMGAPDMEEFMFSYCWKVHAEDVRTFAKAMWQSDVGVWIDVIKLCPGDEIRPMLRSTIRRVYQVVVFLCPEYCASPNCCVELQEAVKHSYKCIFCIIKPVDESVMRFVTQLPGARVVHGFDALATELDRMLRDKHDQRAYAWWRSKRIAGAAVPTSVIPTSAWPIALSSVTGRVFVPEGSQSVGPLYLAGDCRSSGVRFMPPWLLLLTLVGWTINTADLYFRYHDQSMSYSGLDYAWLSVVALCTLVPLLSLKRLLDTRIYITAGLKPLLASKSLLGGVMVDVIGSPDDPVVIQLRSFLYAIGHLAMPTGAAEANAAESVDEEQLRLEMMAASEASGQSAASANLPSSDASLRRHVHRMAAAAASSGDFDTRPPMSAGSRQPEWSRAQKEAMRSNTVEAFYEQLTQRQEQNRTAQETAKRTDPARGPLASVKSVAPSSPRPSSSPLASVSGVPASPASTHPRPLSFECASPSACESAIASPSPLPLPPLSPSLPTGRTGLRHRGVGSGAGAATGPGAAASLAFLDIEADQSDEESESSSPPLLLPSSVSPVSRLSPVRIFVLDSVSSRDVVFGGSHLSLLDPGALYVWSSLSLESPFDGSAPAQRMMQYLVMVAAWEKDALADSVFAAIAIRAAIKCHSGDTSG